MFAVLPSIFLSCMIAIETEEKIVVSQVATDETNNCPLKTALRIEQSIAYMEQHLNRPLHVAVFAFQAGFTTSYFYAAFKRRTGYSPLDYFTRLRMMRACQLLESPLLNVKEVASQLGYRDPLYFSRVFKSVNGVAPSDYRLAQRKMASKAWYDRAALSRPLNPSASPSRFSNSCQPQIGFIKPNEPSALKNAMAR